MDKSQKALALIFNKVLSGLMNLSSEEIEKLSDKGYDIELKVVRKRTKDEVELVPAEDFKALIEKLTSFGSRDEASDFLLRTFETKKPVEQLARSLDIPILKQDKVETLRDKIIEATVGARIRSDAIKGKS